MQLTKHFNIRELTQSSTATRLGINNTLPAILVGNMVETAEMLERIRSHLSSVAGKDTPVTVTSGYRCLPLNRALKSSDESDHVKARAADIEVPSFGSPYQVAAALAPMVGVLKIGQLILEYPDSADGGWVHVSTSLPKKLVNRIITIKHSGTVVGIVK